MGTKLFRELEIGQRFRMRNFPKTEWIKIEPVRFTAGQARYNAIAADGQRTSQIGHGAKCSLPPYDPPDAKPPSVWQQLTPRVRAKGWRNVGDLLAGLLAGTVAIPRKPE